MDAPSPKYHNQLALHQSEGTTDDNFDFRLDHHEAFHVVFTGKLDASKGSKTHDLTLHLAYKGRR